MGMILEEDKAKELFDMVKENNRMLKAMRRDAFIGGVIQFVWWIIIIVVLPYISWLFIQPYLEGVLSAYSQAQGQSAQVSDAIKELQNAGSGFDFQKILEQFTGATGK